MRKRIGKKIGTWTLIASMTVGMLASAAPIAVHAETPAIPDFGTATWALVTSDGKTLVAPTKKETPGSDEGWFHVNGSAADGYSDEESFTITKEDDHYFIRSKSLDQNIKVETGYANAFTWGNGNEAANRIEITPVEGGFTLTATEAKSDLGIGTDGVLSKMTDADSTTGTATEAAVFTFVDTSTYSGGGETGSGETGSGETGSGETGTQENTTLSIQDLNGSVQLNWQAVEGATSYNVYSAPSAFATYTKVNADPITDTTYTVSYTADTKWNYYKVSSVVDGKESVVNPETYEQTLPENWTNEDITAPEKDYVSLETEQFGDNVYIFADTDDTEAINRVILATFVKQNDYANDAQFNENRYSFYFKPGNYQDTDSMLIGFYTSIAGLGKLPTDVELNTLEVPAYLDERTENAESGRQYWEDGGADGIWRNATCNFWRSAENLSCLGATGDALGASYGTKYKGAGENWRTESALNWAVAQAAPMRRIYTTLDTRFDWSWGWASGGYVADSKLLGTNSGTDSGQQFYMRNSEISGNTLYCTLNSFFQGVQSSQLPTTATDGWEALSKEKNGETIGYSNWSVAGTDNAQQVVTSINETPLVREKPFLYLDTDTNEYKVFVPDWQRRTSGTTWSDTDMGAGKSLSLDEFYIATEENDGADLSNVQAALNDGRNVFFTPGIYHATTALEVTTHDQIVLGTGFATIICDNSDTAIRVADENGIIIAGLLLDAGAGSEYLIQVGAEGSEKNHQQNPTLISDVFLRIGGTTDSTTKANVGMDINSNNVVVDHTWIWRADHGTGVRWGQDGNFAKNGLVVDGDNVTGYGLFVEHFEEYNTLWRGENGETYFYQNETPYDPFNQDAYKSHSNTVNGYSSYKVANNVDNHYAVGLGIYNVFIYAGESYDSSQVSIQLDNAMEVPNKDGVLIENACTQTFARAEGKYQSINSVINGVGGSVSSGKGTETNEEEPVGEGWSRKFVTKYNNGTAVIGTVPTGTSTMTGTTTQSGIAQPTNDPNAGNEGTSQTETKVYPVIQMTSASLVSVTPTTRKATFVSMRRVPVCYTIASQGFEVATKADYSNAKTFAGGSKALLGTFTLNINGVKCATMYARAYLTYTDQYGNTETIYSDWQTVGAE